MFRRAAGLLLQGSKQELTSGCSAAVAAADGPSVSPLCLLSSQLSAALSSQQRWASISVEAPRVQRAGGRFYKTVHVKETGPQVGMQPVVLCVGQRLLLDLQCTWAHTRGVVHSCHMRTPTHHSHVLCLPGTWVPGSARLTASQDPRETLSVLAHTTLGTCDCC